MLFFVVGFASRPPAMAEEFSIPVGFGIELPVSVSHAGPSGDLVTPSATAATPFRPPSIFSAPLPTGSGARALGLGGAFTAVADDATAASWNPAGLIQLEVPEASMVLRYSHERDRHHSSDSDVEVGDNEFDSLNLNYLSIVKPLFLKRAERNAVISLNLQEAYDFTQSFSANVKDHSNRRATGSKRASFTSTQTDKVVGSHPGGSYEFDVTTVTDSDVWSSFDQRLSSDLLSHIDFDQQGAIFALTPAIAVEISPKFAMGISLNYYMDSPLPGQEIRSESTATFEGLSSSRVQSSSTRNSSASFSYTGSVTFDPAGGFPGFTVGPISDSGDLGSFSDTSTSTRQDAVPVEGIVQEVNTFEELHGYNATIGFLSTISKHLTIGASVDLPWTAEAEQRKVTTTHTKTYNASKTRVVNTFDAREEEVADIEFRFPLFWTAGALWKWTPEFYTALDIGQTLWSDFSFKAEGSERINPLNGQALNGNRLDDTWAVRLGSEYLIVRPTTLIPIRGGVAWEQRPAIGRPDDFYIFSLGSGFSIGQGPGQIIIDFAYFLTYGSDIHGISLDGTDISSDVIEHQGFVSCIKHF